MRTIKQTKPRARKDGLIVQELPDETLVYDLERDRAHCLNQTAAFVWQRCNGRTTPKEIADALRPSLSQPVDEKLVWLALDQLGRNHLLDDAAVPPPAFAALNRRELVRALGLTAAVAIPVVASIVAPMPSQAATGCIGSGGSCAGNPGGCCSGLVCDTGNSDTCV
jgi:coenzyme PQQ synthesis protein D (PqqD)